MNEGPQRDKLSGRWSTVSGLPMHARVSAGAVPEHRPPVVLVHGLGVSSRYMIPTAERLAPDFRVFAPDLPGFGKSAKPPHVLNIPELADALAAWMDAVGLDRAAFLGNSFGCQIIAELALRRPERVLRAVLVGPSVDPSARSAVQEIARLLVDALREPLSLIPIVLYDYLTAGLVRTAKTFKYLLEDLIREKLARMQVPVLVVRGERDPIVPRRWAEEAARLLPQGRLAEVAGAAHAVNYNAPVALVRIVRPFLLEECVPAAAGSVTGRAGE